MADSKTIDRKAKAVGIDLERAQRAHEGTSMVPRKRAIGAVTEVRNMVARTTRALRKKAKSPLQKSVAKSEIAGYKRTLADKYNAVLDAKSRTMSAMITGPSNFPTRRNQKRMDTEMKRTKELIDWDAKAQKSMQKAVIGSASPEMKNAAEWGKLQREINRSMATVAGIDQKADGFRGYTRSAFTNSIQGKIKRLAAAGETDLVNKSLQHIKDSQAKLKKPIFTDRSSVWSLGTAAEKSTVAKAAQAATAKANPEVRASVQFKGVDIVENRAADRLQLRFPSKPDASVRSELKSRGFRWSPKESAWQRQLTDNARSSAVSALDKVGFGRSDAAAPAPPSSPAVRASPPQMEQGVKVSTWSSLQKEQDAKRFAATEAAIDRRTPSVKSNKQQLNQRIKDVSGMRAKMEAEHKLTKSAAKRARVVREAMGVDADSVPIAARKAAAISVSSDSKVRQNVFHAARVGKNAAPIRDRMTSLQAAEQEIAKGRAAMSEIRKSFRDEVKGFAAEGRKAAAGATAGQNAYNAELKQHPNYQDGKPRTAPKHVDASGQEVAKPKPQTESAKPKTTVKTMRAEAKAAGLKGYSKLNKAALADALKGAGAAGWSDAAREASAKSRADNAAPAEKPLPKAVSPKPGEAAKAPKKAKLSERQKLQAKHQRIGVTASKKGMVTESQKVQQRWAESKLRSDPKSPSFSAAAYEKLTRGRAHSAADINTLQFAEGKNVKLPNGQVLNSTWYSPPTKTGGPAMEPLAAREQKYANWIKQGKPKNFHWGVALTVGAPIAAALMAYDATKSSAMAAGNGKTANTQALKAAAVAGGSTFAVGGAIAATIKYGMHASAVVAKVGSRVLPFALPAMAVYGAVQGYRKDGVRGAALGALDVPTFGLASYAASKIVSGDRAKADRDFRTRRDTARQTARGAKSDGRVAAHTRRSGTKLIHVDSRMMSPKETRARQR